MSETQYNSEPDLAFYMELMRKHTLQTLNAHHIGTVQYFDPTNQSATATINYKKLYNGEVKEYPILIDCPCIVINGGGGYISFPISKGDTCLVIFNDVDMDHWVSSGQMAPPETVRSHGFKDAILLVGIKNFTSPISGYDGTNVVIHSKTKISLENEVTNLKSVLNGLIDAIKTVLSANAMTGVDTVTSAAVTGSSIFVTTALDTFKNTIAGLLK